MADIVQDIFEEYTEKREMYMLAVQSGIYKLLIIMARQMKTNGDFKYKRSDGECISITYGIYRCCIRQNRLRLKIWQKCAV